jgi:hypothetical protein
MMPVPKLFQRGLSDAFVSWLRGETGRDLIDAFVGYGLDVRLRGDYLNAYRVNCSVAKVVWQPRRRAPMIEVSRKYLVDTPLLPSIRDENYVRLGLSTEGCRAFRDALPKILGTVDTSYCSPEGAWERDCVASNLEGTPLLVIDRQIANDRARLDVLAVAVDSATPKIVAVEIKRDLDSRIQHVPAQAYKYMRMLDPTGSGLRADVASSYQRVCAQLRRIGFKACAPHLIRQGMPVLGLVALANYNARSEYLDRAKRRAQELDRPVRFCFLKGERPILPPPADWFS